MQVSAYNLNELVVLDALLDTGSVREAATRVGLTPSAVSHVLARCRKTFGDPLLVRAGQRLQPTPRAEVLRAPIHDVVLRVERLLAPADAWALQGVQGRFRLALSDHGELTVFAPLSEVIAREAPGVDLQSIHLHGDALLAALRDGSIDLAVGVFPELPDDFHVRPLRKERLVCMVREGHPAARKSRLTLAHYVELEHVLISQQGTSRGLVDKLLAERGLRRRIARTVTSFLVAPFLVARSDYVVTIAERVANTVSASLPLVTLPPPLRVDFSLQLLWHRRNDHDPVQRWLRERVAEID